jgi:hypothetical protein
MNRSGFSLRPLLSVAVVLAIAGLIHHWVHRTRAWASSVTRALPIPLSEVPTTIGSYKSNGDFELPPDVARVAQVDRFLHREYMPDDSILPIVLYVGYWGRPNVGLGHGPEVCYPAAGWKIEGDRSEKEWVWESEPGRSCKVKTAVHHFVRVEPEGIKRLSVAFTAVVGGQYVSTSRGAFLHKPPRNGDEAFVAHIQVSSPGNDQDETDDRVFEFMKTIMPSITRCLFGKQLNSAIESNN